MAQFRSEYVGGPADGQYIVTPYAPREGDYKTWTVNGVTHLYVWRKFAHLPPAWRYAGVPANALEYRL